MVGLINVVKEGQKEYKLVYSISDRISWYARIIPGIAIGWSDKSRKK